MTVRLLFTAGVIVTGILTGGLAFGGELFNDDFNADVSGGVPALWLVDEGNGDISVVQTPDASDNCVRVTDNSTTGNPTQAVREFTTARGLVTVDYKVRPEQTTSLLGAAYIQDSAGQNGIPCFFDASGNFCTYNGSSAAVLQRYQAQTWITVSLDINTETGLFDVRIDGVLKGSRLAMRNPIANIGKIMFYVGSAPTGAFYFDDVRVSDTLAPVPTPDTTIVLDTDAVYQTIRGWGGNVYANALPSISASNPAYFQQALVDLPTTHMRIRSYWELFEMSNDNSNPDSINWDAFAACDTGTIHQEFLGLKELADRGVKLSFAAWRFPYWMIGETPSYTGKMSLPVNMEAEFIESLSSYLLYARQHYGIKYSTLSISNEPDIGIYITGLTPTRYASITGRLKARMDSLGYPLRYIGGDVGQATDVAANYAAGCFSADTQGALSILAYHSYGKVPGALSRFGSTAASHGVPVWVAEMEDNANASPPPVSSWTRAVNNAVCLFDVLTLSNAEVIETWCYSAWNSPGGLVMYDPVNLAWFPTYHMLKHFHREVPVLSRRISATPSMACNNNLYTLAFMRPDGKRVFILINKGAAQYRIRLMAGQCALKVHISDTLRSYQELPSMISLEEEGLTLSIPARSVMSLLEEIGSTAIQEPLYGNSQVAPSLALHAAPNPFNPSVTISYRFSPSLHNPAIKIYNMQGRMIRQCVLSGKTASGTWIWDGRNDNGAPVSAGVYLCKIQNTGQGSLSHRLTLIR